MSGPGSWPSCWPAWSPTFRATGARRLSGSTRSSVARAAIAGNPGVPWATAFGQIQSRLSRRSQRTDAAARGLSLLLQHATHAIRTDGEWYGRIGSVLAELPETSARIGPSIPSPLSSDRGTDVRLTGG